MAPFAAVPDQPRKDGEHPEPGVDAPAKQWSFRGDARERKNRLA